MATPREKLAESLEELKKLQDKGFVAIKSSELSRIHKERLLNSGFLKEVFKGWYISVPHNEQQGDSTSWYSSYWHFCSRYLNDRFKTDYCISAEQSLLIHSGNETVPHQLIVRSTIGTNSSTSLPHDTSLFTMKSPLPQVAEVIEKNGLRILSLPSSLIHCSPTLFINNPTDVRTALAMIRDSSEILGLLLDGGHSRIAGRLVGAFRNIGQGKIADDIIKTMKTAGYDVRESDPFENKPVIELSSQERSPYVNRIKLMWHEMREIVIKDFPKASGIPEDVDKYMQQVEEIYATDAYHSLSIERYKVTPELIERVKSGDWDVNDSKGDKQQRDAMAARGYWQASQKVHESIREILKGDNSGQVLENDHSDWYRELFAPSVTVGILKPSDLAGYRTNQVYIGQSKHVPLNKDAVRDAMPVLFELLKKEPESSVRAVLGHFIFVFIHPYMDGNGRMARFLMNVMLASGGYPWTVIRVEQRNEYMESLEKASTELNIDDFSGFIARLVKGREEIAPKVEFPPYKFYQNPNESKLKTWRIDLGEEYSKLHLYNISLDPITIKNTLNLSVKIETQDKEENFTFSLGELHNNPVFEDTLFFHNKDKFIEVSLPQERTWVTFEIEMKSEVDDFEMKLACQYV